MQSELIVYKAVFGPIKRMEIEMSSREQELMKDHYSKTMIGKSTKHKYSKLGETYMQERTTND